MRVACLGPLLDGLGAAFGAGELVQHAGGPLDADAVVVVVADMGTDAAAVEALRAFAAEGRPVLGLGAGFAALCAAGLLPGRVEPMSAGLPRLTHARIEGRATPFTWAIPAGRVVTLAAAPSIRYAASDGPALEAAGRIVLRYCDGSGGAAGRDEVAGICSEAGNVVGLLPEAGLGPQLIASLRLRWRQ